MRFLRSLMLAVALTVTPTAALVATAAPAAAHHDTYYGCYEEHVYVSSDWQGPYQPGNWWYGTHRYDVFQVCGDGHWYSWYYSHTYYQSGWEQG